MTLPDPWRRTTQHLMPAEKEPRPDGYDIYGTFAVDGVIERGWGSLAQLLHDAHTVVADGYGGVFWEDFRERLDAALRAQGTAATWIDVATALRSEDEIAALVEPFLGGDDPLWGTRYDGELAAFFDPQKLSALQPTPEGLTILYGTGAALAGWAGALVYLDVPKNEIQFRARAGAIANLGANMPDDPKAMYKRFYFVDWVALNRHKAALLPRIDIVVDVQRPDDPTWMEGEEFRSGLRAMSRSWFRVRPWFEPGPWGGQWIKEHIPQLPRDVPNYAWSFELIVPENGLLLEHGGVVLETSFDMLMYFDHRAVVGASADRWGYEFPIRFDFLDTFSGGNLSVQCHPRPAYMREHFGENFTQDETYYILDCAPDAQVYLGFRDDIEPAAFRAALETSLRDATPIEIERWVNVEPAHKHDLFLIPNGTIHCSGVDNLVLEISATPYIFTFKMYDWLRLDLHGLPRPLNIARAFDNLHFDRKGARIRAEFVSQPTVVAHGDDWQRVHLPTHAEHFYDVHRWDFGSTVEGTTDDSCQVMSVVEGAAVELHTPLGHPQRFHYAETFVVPAAAGRYQLRNVGDAPVKVITASIKATSISVIPSRSEESRT